MHYKRAFVCVEINVCVSECLSCVALTTDDSFIYLIIHTNVYTRMEWNCRLTTLTFVYVFLKP